MQINARRRRAPIVVGVGLQVFSGTGTGHTLSESHVVDPTAGRKDANKIVSDISSDSCCTRQASGTFWFTATDSLT